MSDELTGKEMLRRLYEMYTIDHEVIMKWKNIFEDHPEMGEYGMFTRMWNDIESMKEAFKSLPCDKVEAKINQILLEQARRNGFSEGVKSTKKEKAKKIAVPAGIIGGLGALITLLVEIYLKSGA